MFYQCLFTTISFPKKHSVKKSIVVGGPDQFIMVLVSCPLCFLFASREIYTEVDEKVNNEYNVKTYAEIEVHCMYIILIIQCIKFNQAPNVAHILKGTTHGTH